MMSRNDRFLSVCRGFMSPFYKQMNKKNQRQLFSNQEKLFYVWDQKQVSEEYRSWFLSFIDALKQKQALQQIQLQQKRMHQNRSHYHLIKEATNQRRKTLQKLEKALKDQSNTKLISSGIKSLRDINYRLCELYVKVCEYPKSKGVNTVVYPGISSIIKQIDEQNDLVRNSYLGQHLEFQNTFDPFFINPYKTSIKNKANAPTYAIRAIYQMFSLNATTLYQYTRLRNKLIQYLCQQEPPAQNIPARPARPDSKKSQLFDSSPDKIYRKNKQPLLNDDAESSNSPYQSKKTDSSVFQHDSCLGSSEKFSLPYIRSNHDHKRKESLFSQRIGNPDCRGQVGGRKNTDRRRTVHIREDNPSVQNQPQTISTNDREDTVTNFGKIKIRKNKTLLPIKTEQFDTNKRLNTDNSPRQSSNSFSNSSSHPKKSTKRQQIQPIPDLNFKKQSLQANRQTSIQKYKPVQKNEGPEEEACLKSEDPEKSQLKILKEQSGQQLDNTSEHPEKEQKLGLQEIIGPIPQNRYHKVEFKDPGSKGQKSQETNKIQQNTPISYDQKLEQKQKIQKDQEQDPKIEQKANKKAEQKLNTKRQFKSKNKVQDKPVKKGQEKKINQIRPFKGQIARNTSRSHIEAKQNNQIKPFKGLITRNHKGKLSNQDASLQIDRNEIVRKSDQFQKNIKQQKKPKGPSMMVIHSKTIDFNIQTNDKNDPKASPQKQQEKHLSENETKKEDELKLKDIIIKESQNPNLTNEDKQNKMLCENESTVFPGSKEKSSEKRKNKRIDFMKKQKKEKIPEEVVKKQLRDIELGQKNNGKSQRSQNKRQKQLQEKLKDVQKKDKNDKRNCEEEKESLNKDSSSEKIESQIQAQNYNKPSNQDINSNNKPQRKEEIDKEQKKEQQKVYENDQQKIEAFGKDQEQIKQRGQRQKQKEQTLNQEKPEDLVRFQDEQLVHNNKPKHKEECNSEKWPIGNSERLVDKQGAEKQNKKQQDKNESNKKKVDKKEDKNNQEKPEKHKNINNLSSYKEKNQKYSNESDIEELPKQGNDNGLSVHKTKLEKQGDYNTKSQKKKPEQKKKNNDISFLKDNNFSAQDQRPEKQGTYNDNQHEEIESTDRQRQQLKSQVPDSQQRKQKINGLNNSEFKKNQQNKQNYELQGSKKDQPSQQNARQDQKPEKSRREEQVQVDSHSSENNKNREPSQKAISEQNSEDNSNNLGEKQQGNQLQKQEKGQQSNQNNQESGQQQDDRPSKQLNEDNQRQHQKQFKDPRQNKEQKQPKKEWSANITDKELTQKSPQNREQNLPKKYQIDIDKKSERKQSGREEQKKEESEGEKQDNEQVGNQSEKETDKKSRQDKQKKAEQGSSQKKQEIKLKDSSQKGENNQKNQVQLQKQEPLKKQAQERSSEKGNKNREGQIEGSQEELEKQLQKQCVKEQQKEEISDKKQEQQKQLPFQQKQQKQKESQEQEQREEKSEENKRNSPDEQKQQQKQYEKQQPDIYKEKEQEKQPEKNKVNEPSQQQPQKQPQKEDELIKQQPNKEEKEPQKGQKQQKQDNSKLQSSKNEQDQNKDSLKQDNSLSNQENEKQLIKSYKQNEPNDEANQSKKQCQNHDDESDKKQNEVSQQNKGENQKQTERSSSDEEEEEQTEEKKKQKKQIKIQAGDMDLQSFFNFVSSAKIKKIFRKNFQIGEWKEQIRKRNCFLTLFLEVDNQKSTIVSFGVSAPNAKNYDYEILYWGVIKKILNQRAEAFVFKKYLTYLQKFTNLQQITLPPTVQDEEYFSQFGFEPHPITNIFQRKSLNIQKYQLQSILTRQILYFHCINLLVARSDPSEMFYSQQIQKFSEWNHCGHKVLTLCQEKQVKRISPEFQCRVNLPEIQYANNILEENGLEIFSIDPSVVTPKCGICYLKKNITLKKYFYAQKGYFIYQGRQFRYQDRSLIRIVGDEEEYSIFFSKDFKNIIKFVQVCVTLDQSKGEEIGYCGIRMFSKQLYGATKFFQKKRAQGYGNWLCALSWDNEIKGVIKKELPPQKYLFGPENFYLSIFYKKSMVLSLQICSNDFIS